MRKNLLVAAFAIVGLSACTTFSPDYVKPQAELPDAWGVAGGRKPLPPGANWWAIYRDERLTKLVEEALANNTNLAVAVARVDEARGQLGWGLRSVPAFPCRQAPRASAIATARR